MQYRKLAGTDLELSEITYGSMTMAPKPDKPDPERLEEGKKALNLALDMGVNSIHSAQEYGTRYAVGQALKERSDRKDIKHIIKLRIYKEGQSPAALLRQQIESALDEMDASRIDVLQWIVPGSESTKGTPEQAEQFVSKLKDTSEDVMAEFEKLQKEGKAGYMGFFAYSEPFARKMAESGMISALNFYYNMWDTTILPTLDQLDKQNMSAVVYRPFSGGMLTTKRADISKLPADDKYQPDKRKQLLIDRDRVFKEVGFESDNLTRDALKFCLAHPNVGTVITGLNTREQVKEVLPIADGNYPDREIAWKFYKACEKLGVGASL